MKYYACEVSLSLDAAAKRLDEAGVRYKTVHERVLWVKPSREAKEILDDCGFYEVERWP